MTQLQRFTPTDRAGAQAMSRAEAIAYHYDQDTRFFSLWLDPSLSYSAGRWFDPVTGRSLAGDLSEAQAEKVRHHLAAARVGKGSSVVDVGCGWGAVLHEAVASCGAARAVGLTLSADQLEYVRGARWPGVEIHLHDVFAYEAEAPFDAAISIGAFEHFAKPSMSRPEKIETYAAFFERLAAMLRPGARFSLQTIVWDDVPFELSKTVLPEHVFPQSDIPYIEEIVEASEATFRLVYLENDPKHYALTLDAWIANLKENREIILAEWGVEKYDFFEHYLRSSRLAFTRRKNSLARLVLVRR